MYDSVIYGPSNITCCCTSSRALLSLVFLALTNSSFSAFSRVTSAIFWSSIFRRSCSCRLSSRRRTCSSLMNCLHSSRFSRASSRALKAWISISIKKHTICILQILDPDNERTKDHFLDISLNDSVIHTHTHTHIEREREREREGKNQESLLNRIRNHQSIFVTSWVLLVRFALGCCRDGSASSLEAVVTRSVCLRYASVSIVRRSRLSWWNVYGRSVFIGLLDHRRRSVSFCDRRTQSLADDAMVCYVMGAACGCHTLSVVLI